MQGHRQETEAAAADLQLTICLALATSLAEPASATTPGASCIETPEAVNDPIILDGQSVLARLARAFPDRADRPGRLTPTDAAASSAAETKLYHKEAALASGVRET